MFGFSSLLSFISHIHLTEMLSSLFAISLIPLYLFFFALQFNVTIDDEPESLAQTKEVIDTKSGESILTRLPLCVEISLKTADNDTMILEVWSLSCNRQLLDKTSRVSYSIYNRMGTLLKSLVQVTRSTPAYKLSRKKSMGCFDIFYRIYSGNPQIDNLGEWLAR